MATGIGISNSDHVLSFSASQVTEIIAKRTWFSKNREKIKPNLQTGGDFRYVV